jgi:hypothetical protein
LTRIFAITVPAFLPREKPISRKAKPACMNITRMPATSTQMELIPIASGSLPATASERSCPSANAAPGAASSASSPAPVPSAHRVLRIRPPLSNSIGGSLGRHAAALIVPVSKIRFRHFSLRSRP